MEKRKFTPLTHESSVTIYRLQYKYNPPNESTIKKSIEDCERYMRQESEKRNLIVKKQGWTPDSPLYIDSKAKLEVLLDIQRERE